MGTGRGTTTIAGIIFRGRTIVVIIIVVVVGGFVVVEGPIDLVSGFHAAGEESVGGLL